MTTSRREGWISGLVIGAISGVILLVVPVAGLVFALVFALVVRLKGSGVAAAGGFGVGAGSSLLALLIRGIAACEAFDAGPGQGCTAPDLAPWLAIGVLALASGVVVTAATISVARRSSRGSAADQRG
jgi:hypothetical protein